MHRDRAEWHENALEIIAPLVHLHTPERHKSSISEIDVNVVSSSRRARHAERKRVSVS